MQQQQHLPRSSDSPDYQEQYLAWACQHRLIQRSQAPQIIKYADPYGQHLFSAFGFPWPFTFFKLQFPRRRWTAPTRHHRGWTCDGMPNGPGAPYVDSSHHSHLNINQRRRNERDGDSPRPHSANKVPFVVFALLASVPSVPFLLLLKLPLRSTLFSRVLTSIPLSLVLVSNSFSRIRSVALLTLSRRFSAPPRLTSPTSMKLSWSVVQPVSPLSSNSFPTSSTAKSLIRASALTRTHLG